MNFCNDLVTRGKGGKLEFDDPKTVEQQQHQDEGAGVSGFDDAKADFEQSGVLGFGVGPGGFNIAVGTPAYDRRYLYDDYNYWYGQGYDYYGPEYGWLLQPPVGILPYARPRRYWRHRGHFGPKYNWGAMKRPRGIYLGHRSGVLGRAPGGGMRRARSELAAEGEMSSVEGRMGNVLGRTGRDEKKNRDPDASRSRSRSRSPTRAEDESESVDDDEDEDSASYDSSQAPAVPPQEKKQEVLPLLTSEAQMLKQLRDELNAHPNASSGLLNVEKFGYSQETIKILGVAGEFKPQTVAVPALAAKPIAENNRADGAAQLIACGVCKKGYHRDGSYKHRLHGGQIDRARANRADNDDDDDDDDDGDVKYNKRDADGSSSGSSSGTSESEKKKNFFAADDKTKQRAYELYSNWRDSELAGAPLSSGNGALAVGAAAAATHAQQLYANWRDSELANSPFGNSDLIAEALMGGAAAGGTVGKSLIPSAASVANLQLTEAHIQEAAKLSAELVGDKYAATERQFKTTLCDSLKTRKPFMIVLSHAYLANVEAAARGGGVKRKHMQVLSIGLSGRWQNGSLWLDVTIMTVRDGVADSESSICQKRLFKITPSPDGSSAKAKLVKDSFATFGKQIRDVSRMEMESALEVAKQVRQKVSSFLNSCLEKGSLRRSGANDDDDDDRY